MIIKGIPHLEANAGGTHTVRVQGRTFEVTDGLREQLEWLVRENETLELDLNAAGEIERWRSSANESWFKVLRADEAG